MMTTTCWRPAELDGLRTRIRNFTEGVRQNVAVLGRYGLGKTTLLAHGLSSAETAGVSVVYVELPDASPQVLVQRLVAALEPLIQRPTEPIRQHLRLAHEGVARGAFVSAAQHAFQAIPLIMQANPAKLILALDEFPRLVDLGLEGLFSHLSSHVMMERDLMVILASSEPERAQAIIQRELSLLFGDFEMLPLEPLGAEQVQACLGAALPQRTWDPTAQAFVIAATEGVPWYVDLVAQEISRSSDARCEVAAPETVEALLRLLDPASGALHWYFLCQVNRWKGPRPRVEVDRLLLALSEQSLAPAELARRAGLSPADTKTWVAKGVEHGLLGHNAACVWIQDAMMALWIHAVYEPWRHGVASWPAFRREIARQRLAQALGRFTQQTQQGVEGAIRRLMGRLGGLRMEIAGKRRHIPDFVDVRALDPHRDLFLAKDHTSFWLCQVASGPVGEGELRALAEFRAAYPARPQQTILVTSGGVASDVAVVAKELEIWVWDRSILRSLWKTVDHLVPW